MIQFPKVNNKFLGSIFFTNFESKKMNILVNPKTKLIQSQSTRTAISHPHLLNLF